MSEHSDAFYRRLESIVADLDDVMEEYQVMELFDCETELEEARETISEVLYKISRI